MADSSTLSAKFCHQLDVQSDVPRLLLLGADPEETVPRKFKLNSAGLLLISANFSAPVDHMPWILNSKYLTHSPGSIYFPEISQVGPPSFVHLLTVLSFKIP